MKPRESTNTTTGSTFRPGDSSVYNLNIVLVLPPAPAALVLAGLALATLSALSAAAFLRIAVLAPPGGDEGRAVLEPADGGAFAGELGRGEDMTIRDGIKYEACFLVWQRAL